MLAGSLPLLFLHATYQPAVTVDAGSTSLRLTLADLAIAAVAGAAALRARRDGLGRLQPGLWMYAALAVALGWIAVEVALPVLRDEPTAWQEHAVSAAKLAWYALLAPAVPLLLTRRSEAQLFLRAAIALSAAATAWGLLQFLGLVDEFDGRRPAQREPSFLGTHDFAALSAAALTIGILLVAVRREHAIGRAWCVAAVFSGALGVALSGAMTGVVGIWLATAATILAARRLGDPSVRRVLAVIGIAVLVSSGAALLRGSSFERFAEFVGLRDPVESADVGSFVHRSVLAYIGVKIFLEQPVLGAGWQASSEEWAYSPHLDAARSRFPDEPDYVFPSPDHPWGVQNGPIQVLSDLGLVGLGAFAALIALAVSTGARGIGSGPFSFVGVLWLLASLGVWTGLGLVAGIPTAALTWLALGLAAIRV